MLMLLRKINYPKSKMLKRMLRNKPQRQQQLQQLVLRMPLLVGLQQLHLHKELIFPQDSLERNQIKLLAKKEKRRKKLILLLDSNQEKELKCKLQT